MVKVEVSPFLRFVSVALFLLVPVGITFYYSKMEVPAPDVQMEVVEKPRRNKSKNRNNKTKEENNNQPQTLQHETNNNDTIPHPEKGDIMKETTELDANSLRSSREAERNLLILLNKRFEKIIEKNRQLEQANKRLTTEFEITQKECAVKVTEITSKVNEQLQEARNDVANAQKEAQTLTFTVDALQKQNEDLQNRLEKAVDETGLQQKLIGQLENKVGGLESLLKKESQDKSKLQKELQDLKNKNQKLNDNLSKTQKNLENECLSKLDLENQLKGQIEETCMKSTLMHSEMTQLKATTDQMLRNRDEQQQKDFEKKLEKCMENLRNEYNKKLDENRKEQGTLYSMKESEQLETIADLKKQIVVKTEELGAAAKKLGALGETLNKLEGERNELKSRLSRLEDERKAEREKLAKEIVEKDESLKVKAEEKRKYLSDYQHLYDVKVALDNELATYRALLETEEYRLEIGIGGLEAEILKDENDNTVTSDKH